MNKVIYGALGILLIACSGWFMFSATDELTVATPTIDDATEFASQELSVVETNTKNVESDFVFDSERLHDLSYENDAELVEFAKSFGRSPACLIEIVRHQVEGGVFDVSLCPQNRDTSMDQMVILPGEFETKCSYQYGREFCQRVKVGDHPYEAYSDDELRSLAQSSPEAAVILARRQPDAASSEVYYEQAVALSGRPGPLEEWMLQRNLGGLIRHDGALDVDNAIIGYEIYLTTDRFGYGSSAMVEYERSLLEVGVDLEPIRERAAARYSRLTATRNAMLGRDWND